jgi:hypothetical protein
MWRRLEQLWHLLQVWAVARTRLPARAPALDSEWASVHDRHSVLSRIVCLQRRESHEGAAAFICRPFSGYENALDFYVVWMVMNSILGSLIYNIIGRL